MTEQRGSSRGQGPLLALPHCHSRACFATARQWRGCGNCALPVSATGSGKAQFSSTIARRSKNLAKQGFSKTAFCVRPKCSAGKRSQKSPQRDFFDKLKGASFEAPLCVSGTASGLAVFVLFVEDLQAVDEDIRLQVEFVPAVGDDQGADAAGEHGDSRPAPAVTIMTEDAKTE